MIRYRNYIFISLLFCTTCSNKSGVTFYITNQSNDEVKKIELFPSSRPLIISNLKKEKTEKVFMDFSDAAKVDGSYGITIEKGTDQLANYNFGYFTNGIPLEKEIHIVITNDTFTIDQKQNSYK